MTINFDDLIQSNSWPCVEAKRILDNVSKNPPKKGYVLFETGYAPSGLPHIGTFAEVKRTIMVQKAFEQISDIPTKLICFSDDMDGLRKVPSNLPNQDMISKHLGLPLTSIPDPFGIKESFGAYMNAKLCEFLDRFGFNYNFCSATEYYKSGKFDSMMIKVLEAYEDIMNLMLPTFGEERRKTYSPFMPLCPDTGKVLQVPIESINKKSGSISYKNEQGELVTVPVIGGNCKLQWKPDFGMRWAALEVDYEMYGKDHKPSAHIYNSICKILGGTPPTQLFYEMFLDEEGGKISKSKGNSISVDDWMRYAPLESMSLFMYPSPTKAKRLHLEIIPKCVDEYLAFNKQYFVEQDIKKKITNPVYHIHNGKVPQINTFGITFSLLLNLVSIYNPKDSSIVWSSIIKYASEASPEKSPYLDIMVNSAMNYYHDFIKDHKVYLTPSDEHKKLLREISHMLHRIPEDTAGSDIQTELYTIGKKSHYENLREFFKEIYQILLGQTQGPRLGPLFKLYGIQDTIKLIEEKL